jgi:hypothetical protein
MSHRDQFLNSCHAEIDMVPVGTILASNMHLDRYLSPLRFVPSREEGPQ